MSSIPQRAVARLLAVLLLASLAATAHAAETWYMVELVVFAPRNPDAGSELWSPDRALGLQDKSAALTIPAADGVVAKDSRILPLPAEQQRLQAEVKRLADGGNYTVLLHTGWRQPGLAREEAFAVRLQSEPLPGDTATTLNTPLVLDGSVRLILSRYLHLETDLLYRPEAAAAAPRSFFASDEPAEPMAYRLHETRRMRSKEVHYLDHPMFGLIALITPYEVASTPARAPVPAGRSQ